MILEHLNKVMKKMSGNGKWYAKTRCYSEKAITPAQAFITGYIDACAHLERYVKQYGLDTQPKKCYTKRKAHKK